MDQNTTNGCEIASVTADAPNFTDASPESPSAKPAKPALISTRRDVVFAFLFFICGYLFVRLVFESALGVGVTVFTFLYGGVCFAYLRRKGPLPRGLKPCLALITLSGLSFCLIPNESLKLFILFFLMACCLYGVAILCGTRVTGRLDGSLGADLFNQGLLIPFSNFFCNLRVVAAHKTKKTGAFFACLIGLVIAVPVLSVIVPQLTRADAAFEEAASQLLAWCGRYLGQFLFQLPISFLVGCYLYGHLYGNLHPHAAGRITGEETEGIQHTLQKLSPLVFGTTLSLVCAVYIFFLAIQATELVPAILHGAPSRYSHAEFARQGFFELCGVSAFNLLLMAAAWLLTRAGDKRPPSQRILFSVLSAQTLCLIAVAVGKMLLYINCYGLTQKRIYTLWLMGFLVLVFLTVLVAQITRLPVVRTALCLFCSCFLLLCYLNVNTLIVTYNAAAYQRGALETLEVSSFYAMPAEALPIALELYQSLPAENVVMRQSLYTFMKDAKQQLESDSWHNQNLQAVLAAQTPLPESPQESRRVTMESDFF